MTEFLQQHERIVYAGKTALRAPDGTPLEAVPQYMIVSVDEADPASVCVLRENDRLVMVGTVHADRRAAEERYAAMLEGRACPRADGVPIYIKESAENINAKSGLSLEEEKACKPLVDDLVAAFAAVMHGEKEA